MPGKAPMTFRQTHGGTTQGNNIMEQENATLGNRRSANRLADEKSPYLLQHRFNPVDWYPWCEEAFSKARQENKPIFLSIGYSTCHWCHVMERESFENEEIASFLNRHFISIKVDREERPDIDRLYMTAVQAMTGQGGWPLSVFLTPDKQPFYGGTYFPPEDRYGKPGFLRLLQQIHKIWSERCDDIVNSAENITRQLEAFSQQSISKDANLDVSTLKHAVALLKTGFDSVNGGFGNAPKFPQPALLALFLRCAARFGDSEALRMVCHTCDCMAAGGIHDQLGGGFCRYSVDEQWLVPHFEKMLYDNAQLLDVYLDTFLITGEQRYAEVARGIATYVLRDMTHPLGGFYTAEDADSEGYEGKFYCWSHDELAGLLSSDELNVVCKYFGITETGNFFDHSRPDPLPGQNILHIANPVLTEGERRCLNAARQKMFAARNKRIRPHLDDKVLASWNGLMLASLARAAIILGEESWLQAAEKNSSFIRSHLWDEKKKTLYHRWRDGEHDRVQLLSAYTSQILGHISLYEATLCPACLEFAVALAESMLQRFYDPTAGGFWQSAAASDLLFQIKEDYDGAEPSGNSMAVLGLLKLAAITGRAHFKVAADKTLALFASRMKNLPQALTGLLAALDFSIEPPLRAVVSGNPNSEIVRDFLGILHSVYLPNKIISGTEDSLAGQVHPPLPDKSQPMVLLCSDQRCLPPVYDPESLRESLSKLAVRKI